MKKSYVIIGVIFIIIFSAAAYFQVQANKKMLEDLGLNQNSNQNTSLPAGLIIETIEEGTGEAAKANDEVTVDYVGTLENGTKFDSSVDQGEPFTFTLGAGRVIQGWEWGIVGMKVGEKRKLTVPSYLGYGANDYMAIPGGSTLIFVVDLLGINQ